MQHVLSYDQWKLNECLVNEGLFDDLDLSDVIHIGVDVLAAVADVVVPGAGSTIDVMHMFAYFIEASNAYKNNQRELMTQLIVCGIIQLFAIFDPLNTITIIKGYVKKFFDAIAGRLSPAMKQAAIDGMLKFKDFIAGAINKLTSVIDKMIGFLKDPKMEPVITFICEKLRIKDAFQWIKNFFSNTVKGTLMEFLEILAKFAPKKAKDAAEKFATSGETTEIMVKAGAKLLASQATARKINSTVSDLTDKWIESWNRSSMNSNNKLTFEPISMHKTAR